jgi:hypothetical protein
VLCLGRDDRLARLVDNIHRFLGLLLSGPTCSGRLTVGVYYGGMSMPELIGIREPSLWAIRPQADSTGPNAGPVPELL